MKNIPYFLFLFVLIFAPLAFGTVEDWSLLTVEILAIGAFLFACVQLWQTSGTLLRVPGLLPLLLLAGWMIVQIIPLPAFFIKLVSPAAYQVYKPVHDMLPGSRWLPLSVSVKSGVLESARILSYIFFYILTIQLLRSGERLKQTVKICSWLAIGIAIVALLQKFSSPDKIYWLRPAPANTDPVGPWINRSQFCGYLEMLSPVVLALAFYYRPIIAASEPWRKRIVAWFTMTGGNLHIFLGLGVMLMASSVFVSLSRGGIIALSLSLLIFFVVLGRRQKKYSPLFSLGFLALLVVSMAWFGWGPVLERFDRIFKVTGELNVERFFIWQDSFRIIKDFWLTGSGFGTFVNIFPNYKTIPDDLVYEHAHNDYIELLTDGGIIGFILVAWFVIAVLREGWIMIGRRRDRYSILVGIGAFSGILALLVHEISDFNMHNGADGLYFFFLCGLLVSAGNTRLQYHTQETLLRKLAWPSKGVFLTAGLIALCGAIVVQGGALIARMKYATVKDIYLSRQLAPQYLREISTTVRQAARLDPFEGMYPFVLGDVERYLGHSDTALEYYVQAGQKEPLEGAFLQRIGLMLPKDHQQFAEILMEKGSQRTLKKDELMLSRAEWLLGVGQRMKAIEVLRDGLTRNPKLITSAAPLLQSAEFTREETAAALPATVSAWLRYGSSLEKAGNLDDAEYFYSHALDFLENEKKILGGWFTQVYYFYGKRKEKDKALEILQLGVRKAPEYSPLHILLGDYYAREGIFYRAREEYQQALLLEPKSESVKKRLEQLSKSEKATPTP